MKPSAVIFMLLISLLLAASAWGQDPVERGRDLFVGRGLPANRLTCDTCHHHGRRLGKAPSREDSALVRRINHCIRTSLDAAPLLSASAEMQGLIMYIRSFGLPSDDDPGVK